MVRVDCPVLLDVGHAAAGVSPRDDNGSALSGGGGDGEARSAGENLGMGVTIALGVAVRAPRFVHVTDEPLFLPPGSYPGALRKHTLRPKIGRT